MGKLRKRLILDKYASKYAKLREAHKPKQIQEHTEIIALQAEIVEIQMPSTSEEPPTENDAITEQTIEVEETTPIIEDTVTLVKKGGRPRKP